MRIYIPVFILLSSLLYACQKDVPPELKCDPNHPGEICREDAFERGNFIGSIDYQYYNNGLLKEKAYHSVNQSYLTESFTYDQHNLLINQINSGEDGSIIEEIQYQRTAFDSVENMKITHNGGFTQYIYCQYDSLHRLSNRITSSNTNFTEQQYLYNDNGTLYKELSLDVAGNLVSYKIYYNYLNHVTKIYTCNPDDQVQQIQVILRDTQDKLLEIRNYNSNYLLISRELYTYNQQLLHKKSIIKDQTEIEFRLFHYP